MAYTRLSAEQQEFRLLKRPEGPYDDDSYSFELIVTSIHNAPPFVAASYVWGDPTQLKQILVHKQATNVTENAYWFLRDCHHWSKGTNLLFLDALCINQNDQDEQSSQVSLMRQIYSKAEEVMLYIGHGRTYKDEAFITIANIHSIYTYIYACVQSGEYYVRPDQSFGRSLARIIHRSSPVDSIAWNAIRDLLAEPIWERIWIVQEIALSAARGAAFLCVDCAAINFDWFLLVVRIANELFLDSLLTPPWQDETPVIIGMDRDLERFVRDTRDPKRSMQNICRLGQWIERCKPEFKASDIPLDTLTGTNLFLKATRDHDRVYGLLGLFGGLQILPDYRKTVEEVYKEVAFAYISHTQSLSLIVCKQSCLGDTTVPSWAPDWRRFQQAVVKVGAFYHLYNACAYKQMSLECRNDVLIVSGSVLQPLDETFRIGPGFITRLVGPPWGQLEMAQVCEFAAEAHASPGFRAVARAKFYEGLVVAMLMDVWLYGGAPQRIRDPERLRGLNSKVLTYLESMIEFGRIRAGLPDPQSDLPDSDRPDPDLPSDVESLLAGRNNGYGMLIGISASGTWCMLPSATEQGDVIYILAGASMPMVLRPSRTKPGTLQVIGPAYVHGMMDGQAVTDKVQFEAVHLT